MLENYIEKLRPIVMELFKNNSNGHDIGHLERTMKMALRIQEQEGGDRVIIGISAFLHDIHRIMQDESGVFVSPKDSLPRVREILNNIDLSEEIKDKICYSIEHHEEYNWSGNNVKDLNTLILQDADNLEAIGAIGITRLFYFCGSKNILMYDENIPFDESDDFTDSKLDPTALHHFYHKLFKIEGNMNTMTAKKIAQGRTQCMRAFVDEFLGEWKSEK